VNAHERPSSGLAPDFSGSKIRKLRDDRTNRVIEQAAKHFALASKPGAQGFCGGSSGSQKNVLCGLTQGNA
jgi:hypothetical protein